MYTSYTNKLVEIKNLNNDIVIIETLLDYINNSNDYRRRGIFLGLCHYIFFSNNNLIKNYIDTLEKIAKKYSYNMFENYVQRSTSSLLISISTEDFYLLISHGFPISFWDLDTINKYHKLDLNEIIIDEKNCQMFFPEQTTFTIKTNKYGSIFFQLTNRKESSIDFIKSIKINYSMKLKKILMDYIFIYGGQKLWDFFKEKLVNENLLKYINKNNSDFYVNLVLEKYPDAKFDLTKNHYSKLSFEKILKNKNYHDDDPIFFENIFDDYEITFDYIQFPSLCFISDTIINKYYLTKKITNDEFIECLNKLNKKNNVQNSYIKNVFDKDPELFTFENIEHLLTKIWYKKNNLYQITNFVEHYKKSLNKFTQNEKDRLLFILAQKEFFLFCILVFNMSEPNIKDYEEYDENKGWKFNEEHIIISCFGNPHKTKFLNFIKFCLKHNKISKFDELYVAIRESYGPKSWIELIGNKVTDGIYDLYQKQKVRLNTENFYCSLVY